MPQDSKTVVCGKANVENSRLTVLIIKISSFTCFNLIWYEEYKVYNFVNTKFVFKTYSIHFTFKPYQPYDKKLFNRPFLSSQNPHFQKEAKCTTFLMKMSFICMRMKSHFHIKGWSLILVLIQGPGGTKKWSIVDTASLCYCQYRKLQWIPFLVKSMDYLKVSTNSFPSECNLE